MQRIFDIDWEDLSLDHVRAFLGTADEEGVVWEAKADRPDGVEADGVVGRLRPQHVQASVCGFANQVGGYLIIGARRVNSEWQLPGVRLPNDEPGLWLDQAVRQLRPTPRVRTKTWTVEVDRLVAVIEVEPMIQTPCMTSDGQVFERVSSETLRVKDPSRLAALFARGERARADAEARAARATEQILAHPDLFVGRSVAVAVALSAASYEPDIAARLFDERFNQAVHARAGQRLFDELQSTVGSADVESTIRQGYVEFAIHGETLRWIVRTSWDGTTVVVAGLAAQAVAHHSLFDFIVWPSWRLAADLVRAVGGYGDARLQLTVIPAPAEDSDWTLGELDQHRQRGYGPPPSSGTIYADLPARTEIKRWAEVGEPSSNEIGSIQRELQRAAGLWSFEGHPEPPE
jgi:hypothetical protein